MPYQNASDPKLPDRVRKMSLSKRRQWVSVFNSTFAKHGESRAFAAANSVVKNGKTMEAEEILSYSRKDLSKRL
jgi:hypothetical protein